MIKTLIKGILFDFAGVIGTEGHAQMLSDLVGDWSQIKSDVQILDDLVDNGDISDEDYEVRLSALTGIPANSIRQETKKRIIINDELRSYIKFLKPRYKIGLLSNYNSWLEEIIEENNLEQLFDSLYISYKFHMIKPKAGAFLKALELLGLDREYVVFVDDRKIHVDAANALGIRSLLFTTVPVLKKDLLCLGVR